MLITRDTLDSFIGVSLTIRKGESLCQHGPRIWWKKQRYNARLWEISPSKEQAATSDRNQ
ncbi:hypothetical protein HSB1_47910 [Halogranum salarium B-1]|uniref:Uncharacterized protein n=1 Tax=Halogranum salarium B-1 TaxID=1210908 RepID=J3JCW8_9EURY|nr:hypothetical protein HSB1_47910 [Halogranum salarium B-1]